MQLKITLLLITNQYLINNCNDIFIIIDQPNPILKIYRMKYSNLKIHPEIFIFHLMIENQKQMMLDKLTINKLLMNKSKFNDYYQFSFIYILLNVLLIFKLL